MQLSASLKAFKSRNKLAKYNSFLLHMRWLSGYCHINGLCLNVCYNTGAMSMKMSTHIVTCQSHKNVRTFHLGTLFLYFKLTKKALAYSHNSAAYRKPQFCVHFVCKSCSRARKKPVFTDRYKKKNADISAFWKVSNC